VDQTARAGLASLIEFAHRLADCPARLELAERLEVGEGGVAATRRAEPTDQARDEQCAERC
jgi:hypothetical protein